MAKSQVDVSGNQLTFYPDPSRYSLGVVKFASYVFSGHAHVFIEGNSVILRFHKRFGAKGLKNEEALFKKELEDQKIHSEIRKNNQGIREFIMRKALSGPIFSYEDEEQPGSPSLPESGLTKEQETELDRLIAEVESDIAKETSKGPPLDPLGITATWEEKHGKKRAG